LNAPQFGREKTIQAMAGRFSFFLIYTRGFFTLKKNRKRLMRISSGRLKR
jgi:hypothetical protein